MDLLLPGKGVNITGITCVDPSILDDLLPQKVNLTLRAVDLGCMTGPWIEAVGSPASGREDRVMGQGEDVQEGRPDPSGPGLGKGEIGDRVTHHRPPGSPERGSRRIPDGAQSIVYRS
jgi:hypothetical protein